MQRLCLLLLVAALLATTPALAELSGVTPRKPNIIHIFADDLGKASVGVHGQLARAGGGLPAIKTPHLDALAGAGMTFNRAYSATVCSPSRGMLYLGFNQTHNANDRNVVSPREQDVTLAEVLKPAGYRTGVFGKWGFGGSGGTQTSGAKEDDLRLNPTVSNVGAVPTTHQYDEFLGYLNHSRAHRFFTSSLWTTDPTGTPTVAGLSEQMLGNVGPGNTNLHASYTHDVIASRTEEFIEAHHAAVDPFFMQVNYTIPHNDLEAIQFVPGWLDAYAGIDTTGWTDKERFYAAMITRMDASVGSLVDRLEDPNRDGDTADSILDETMIVFTSDNGATDADFSSNGLDHFGLRDPWRGGKRDLYEGGINMPQFVRWDGVVPAGSTTDHLTDLTDFMATVADLAGVDAPVGIDGHSLAPLLTGEGRQRRRDYLVFEHHEGDGPDNDSRDAAWAIIRDDYKLIQFDGGDRELYDLRADPSEQSPRSLSDPNHAALADELAQLALAEGVEQPASYDHEYAAWNGSSGGRLADASAWATSGGSSPAPTWSAVVGNPTGTASTLIDDAGVTVLGLEVSGMAARQTIRVARGRTLTGLNEVRLRAGGRVHLDDARLASRRWIDLYEGSELTGHGSLEGDVYNGGKIAPGLPADLDALEGTTDVDTGVIPALALDFTGVQDDAPLTATDFLSEYLVLTGGLDFGPGVRPRNAANAGDEFNVTGFVNAEPGSLADAITQGDYLTFSVAPVVGLAMTLEEVGITLWRNGNGAAEEYAVLTSLDGFTAGQQIGQIDLEASDTTPHTLTGVYTGGEASTAPVEVRVYGWDANGDNGNTHFTGVVMTASFESVPGVTLTPTGVLELVGDYVQLAEGTLELQLAGTNNADPDDPQHDQLVVAGDAELGGALLVTLATNDEGLFTPAIGDRFELVTATDGLGGIFSEVDLPELPLGQNWYLDYETGVVALEVVARLVGDYNGDGRVDAADYALYRDHLGDDPSAFAEGSRRSSLTGRIGPDDYAAWAQNYGLSLPAVAIPEPGTLLVTLLAFAMAACQSERRSRY